MTFPSGSSSKPRFLVLITEDWFALSHFQPLITQLADLGDVTVATRLSGRQAEIEALGARVISFDLKRASLNPMEQVGTVRGLAKLFAEEKPDVLHVISMQPMVLAGLATRFADVPHIVLHLTGLGFLGISEGAAAKVIRPAAFAVLKRVLADQRNWLLAENPDDVAYLRDHGADPGSRFTILGGAGLDLGQFSVLAPPQNNPPVAAFVGRMIRSKGLETLVEAQRLLKSRGVDIDIALYGKTDRDNPEAIGPEVLRDWQAEGLLTWHGHTSDLEGVWRTSDIAVLPAITREGLPRSVLEASAFGRPQIVTNVPGCRHFVSDGVEGLVVPPGDAIALADAMEIMAGDASLRARCGAAARRRVEGGFTIEHVQAGIRDAYASVLNKQKVS